MLSAVTGIVLLANFLLAGFIGSRLLRLPAASRFSPERLLAVYFLSSRLVGGLLTVTAYAVWSSLGRTESPSWLVALTTCGLLASAFGYLAQVCFTAVTFHPGALWARAVAGLAIAITSISLIGRGFTEGFAISLDPGVFYWGGYWVRMGGLAWMGVASLFFWRRMRRRLSLGLAEPMLVNRFVLWSAFAFGSLLTALSEPIARFTYYALAGESVAMASSIQDVAGSLITTTLLVTSTFSLMTTTVLFLTFFPTAGYRRWISGGTETQA